MSISYLQAVWKLCHQSIWSQLHYTLTPNYNWLTVKTDQARYTSFATYHQYQVHHGFAGNIKGARHSNIELNLPAALLQSEKKTVFSPPWLFFFFFLNFAILSGGAITEYTISWSCSQFQREGNHRNSYPFLCVPLHSFLRATFRYARPLRVQAFSCV